MTTNQIEKCFELEEREEKFYFIYHPMWIVDPKKIDIRQLDVNCKENGYIKIKLYHPNQFKNSITRIEM